MKQRRLSDVRRLLWEVYSGIDGIGTRSVSNTLGYPNIEIKEKKRGEYGR